MNAMKRMIGVAMIAVLMIGSGGGARAEDPAPILVRDAEVSRWDAELPTDCAQGTHTLDCTQRDTETEPSIAVNPEDHDHAVASFQQGRRDAGGAAVNGFATTFDGGRTWTSGHLPGLTQSFGGAYLYASDPAVAFGPGGIVYVNSLLLDGFGTAALLTNVSRDGGITWSSAADSVTAGEGYGFGVDKNWIVVDHGTGPGHHLGRVYVAWGRFAQIVVAYSDDEGATWHLQHAGYPAGGFGVGVIPVVVPGGDLALLWAGTDARPAVHENPFATIGEAGKSFNGLMMTVARGAGLVPTGGPLVFAPPLAVASYQGRPTRGQRAGDAIPAVAVDERSGRIYAVWNDARYRLDRVNDIVITSSDDAGLTWTVPVPVNPGPRDDHLNVFTPMVGVGPDGDVRVSYRRRQENAFFPVDRVVETVYQVSFDGGATFGDPTVIAIPGVDLGFAAQSRGGIFLGDYSQLAVAGDRTYIERAEPVRVDDDEESTLPPRFHHQRTWVAVVEHR